MFTWLTRLVPGRSIAAQSRERASLARHPRLATCALLVELAYADGVFSPAERTHVARAMCREFGLGRREAEAVIDAALQTRRSGVDLHRVASRIVGAYSSTQIQVLAEIMHDLMYSDGAATLEERYLVRKLRFLLRCEPA